MHCQGTSDDGEVLKGRCFSCAAIGSNEMRALAHEGIFAAKKEMNQRFPQAIARITPASPRRRRNACQLNARAVGAGLISPPFQRWEKNRKNVAGVP